MKDTITKKANDKVEFHIAIRRDDGIGYKWKKILATPIKIKGWEDFEFMYHQSQEMYLMYGKMAISEKECGCLVNWGSNKTDCIKNALANLNTVTKDEFRAKIKEMKKQVPGKKK